MPQHNTVLTSITGRIKLVPPDASGDERLARIRSHPVSREYLRFLPSYLSTEDMRIRRETRAEDPTVFDFMVCLQDEELGWKVVGNSGFFNIDLANNSCEAGILLDPDIHKNGVATETFDTLLRYIIEERKFHRTTFEVGVDNVRMRGWMERVGQIKLEGIRRGAWKEASGEYRDVASYSLLEGEWEVVKAGLERRVLRKSTQT